MSKTRQLQNLVNAIRKFALEMPGAYEEFPWGERVAKVNKKVFVFMSKEPDPKAGFTFSVKLPHSGKTALAFPFAEPCGYGMGKHGWVMFRLMPGDKTPKECSAATILPL
jgi:predicted DNA-binding protein (MmcQ/YjbR family)